MSLARPHVPSEYLPLFAYLDGRFADTVVLTFVDVEALLGFALPDAARVQTAWWSNLDGDTGAAPQSAAWIRALRTARPNLPARVVRFDRTS